MSLVHNAFEIAFKPAYTKLNWWHEYVQSHCADDTLAYFEEPIWIEIVVDAIYDYTISFLLEDAADPTQVPSRKQRHKSVDD